MKLRRRKRRDEKKKHTLFPLSSGLDGFVEFADINERPEEKKKEKKKIQKNQKIVVKHISF